MLIRFPKEQARMVAIQKSLPSAPLAAVCDVVEQLSGRTDALAQTVFQAAMERTEELRQQALMVSHQIGHLSEELNDLALSIDQWAPDEIDAKLEALRLNIASCPEPKNVQLQKQLESVQNLWNHLHFLATFPIAEELNRDSFQSNLIHRMEHQIEELERIHSKQAEACKKRLSTFQELCAVAEEIFSRKDLSAVQRLPSPVQREVERLLGDGKNPDEVAGAIMAVLADQMMK